MIDNLALSFIILIIEKNPILRPSMPENDVDPHASPSLGTSAAYELQPSGTSGAVTGHLAPLFERARGYVDASSAANTRRAYAADWAHFSSWCRRKGLATLPPDAQTVGLYITALASGEAAPRAKPSAVSTIERRLSAIAWNYAQRGLTLECDRVHHHHVLATRRDRPLDRVDAQSAGPVDDGGVPGPQIPGVDGAAPGGCVRRTSATQHGHRNRLHARLVVWRRG